MVFQKIAVDEICKVWYLDTYRNICKLMSKGGEFLEYTNEVLQKMKEKKILFNPRFSRWYYGMYKESGGKIEQKEIDGRMQYVPNGGVESFFNKADRIASCCDLWVWDKYENNKLLDLQRLNRCKNSRFCPNCMMMNTAKFIQELKKKLPLLDDYDLYLMTLTVPSEELDGQGLSDFITKLYYSFRKLNHKFSAALLTPTGKPSSQALQERFLVFAGGVRVLEITYGEKGYHPHLHCLVAVKKDTVSSDRLEKYVQGKWSNKAGSYAMKSDIDMQIGKAWSMLWYGVDFRKWDRIDYSPRDVYMRIDGIDSEFKNLEVDFTPMDEGGIYEVVKYIFKPGDVATYPVFKTLVGGLAYKRIRQGFGIFHDLKCDDDSDGEKQPLELLVEEEPEKILTREFDDLIDTYAEYRKISRFNPAEKEVLFRLADI